MVNHLYIIGNGFDKHHDIPSGYLDYRHWLEENEEWSVIETIDDVFGYTDDDWWSNFEDNLASVDSLKIATEKTFENYPNFGSDEFRDRDWYTAELAVERFINYALLEIKKSFRKWIESLPMGNSIKMIKINKREGIFLTFCLLLTLLLFSALRVKLRRSESRLTS